MATSKKIYEAVAAQFRAQYAANFQRFERAGDVAVADGATDALVERMAQVFANDNPAFDRARFNRAAKEKL